MRYSLLLLCFMALVGCKEEEVIVFNYEFNDYFPLVTERGYLYRMNESENPGAILLPYCTSSEINGNVVANYGFAHRFGINRLSFYREDNIIYSDGFFIGLEKSWDDFIPLVKIDGEVGQTWSKTVAVKESVFTCDFEIVLKDETYSDVFIETIDDIMVVKMTQYYNDQSGDTAVVYNYFSKSKGLVRSAYNDGIRNTSVNLYFIYRDTDICSFWELYPEVFQD